MNSSINRIKMEKKRIKKVVGMLIEVLHGKYSDTRDLAVVQLVLLGEKAVPYICSYLRKEADLENDLKNYSDYIDKIDRINALRYRARTDEYYARVSDFTEEEMEILKTAEEAKAKVRPMENEFKKKWGLDPSRIFPRYNSVDSEIESFLSSRRTAVEGALKALSIIGDTKVIPFLEKLSLSQPRKEDIESLFIKAKETIEKIRRN